MKLLEKQLIELDRTQDARGRREARKSEKS